MKSTHAIRRALLAAFVFTVVALGGWALPGRAATPDQAPPVAPGQSRVWFLRQLLPGENFHPPMLYVNGAPITTIGQGTAFYRDFTPGRYTFSVENCLPQRGDVQTLSLQPYTQYALQVTQDDNGAWDCNPPQVSYLQQVPPQQVPYLFSQVEFAGAR
jgi:hypothetical protein